MQPMFHHVALFLVPSWARTAPCFRWPEKAQTRQNRHPQDIRQLERHAE